MSYAKLNLACREQAKHARVAQLVERDLAKVEAAGSSPVSRSFDPVIPIKMRLRVFYCRKNPRIPEKDIRGLYFP